MSDEALKFLTEIPKLSDGTMLMALNGWMDGGQVSTGTVQGILRGRAVEEIARIEPDPFYIFNFPGPMELASLFRPQVRYEEGIVQELQMPSNHIYCDPAANLLLFVGKEPNLRWLGFAECIFTLARKTGVKRIIFVGSFGGTVPHTRQPRMFASISHPHLRAQLKEHGFRFSGYHGPASFATMLLSQCADKRLEMMSLISEIPGYLQGANPPSIEAVTRRICKMLDLPVDVEGLRRASDEWEIQITQTVEKDVELAQTVRKLEEQYDNDLIGKVQE